MIGAYPKSGRYDLCRSSKAEHEKALQTIPTVPLPDSDPVFGEAGPLLRLWQIRERQHVRLGFVLGFQALDLCQHPTYRGALSAHRR